MATAKFCPSVSPLTVGFPGLGEALPTHLANTRGTAGSFLACTQHHPSLLFSPTSFVVPGGWMQETVCTSILKPDWLAVSPNGLTPQKANSSLVLT